MSTIIEVSQGVQSRISVSLATAPQAYGKAGSLTLKAAMMVGSDLSTVSLTGAQVYEVALPSGEGNATVDDVPTFAANGGPSGEDVYEVSVASVGAISVGMYVKPRKTFGRTYRVLHTATGMIKLHAWVDGFDIEDGDVLDIVVPTGTYSIDFDIDPDTYLSADAQSAQLTITAVSVTAGSGPAHGSAFRVAWNLTVKLSTAAQAVSVG